MKKINHSTNSNSHVSYYSVIVCKADLNKQTRQEFSLKQSVYWLTDNVN